MALGGCALDPVAWRGGPSWSVRGSVVAKLILGGILGFLGLSCSAVSVGMMVAPQEPDDAKSGLIVLILSLVVYPRWSCCSSASTGAATTSSSSG